MTRRDVIARWFCEQAVEYDAPFDEWPEDEKGWLLACADKLIEQLDRIDAETFHAQVEAAAEALATSRSPYSPVSANWTWVARTALVAAECVRRGEEP
jgi:erythromycin esterase-like protein